MKELAEGKGTHDFTVSGIVKIVEDNSINKKDCLGKIVVVKSPDPSIVMAIRNSIGVIAETGGLTSHVAIVCQELNLPAIVGVDNIVSMLHDGDFITMTSSDHEGIIYEVD